MINKSMVCTIAGSDVSGGAGIQGDLHTFQNFDIHGSSIITAITAQSLNKIHEIYYIPETIFKAELQSLDRNIRAIKIGMLGDNKLIHVLINFLSSYQHFVVLDPILTASSGKPLYRGKLVDYLKNLKQLFPFIHLLTPNRHEAEMLLNQNIIYPDDIINAANAFIDMGVKSVVIKGRHFTDDQSQDYWTNGHESFWLTNKRYANKHVHGTSCIFSSAIAACVAQGYRLQDALVIAKMYIHRGIRHASNLKKPTFFPHGLGKPDDEIDLPTLSYRYINNDNPSFMNNDLFEMGLYPIVDSIEWLKLLIPLGIKC